MLIEILLDGISNPGTGTDNNPVRVITLRVKGLPVEYQVSL
jgi:hypothetical protein